jgi:hypothetical protein
MITFKTITENAIELLRKREYKCLDAASRKPVGTTSNTYWMMEFYAAKYKRQRIQTRGMDAEKVFMFVDKVAS